MTKEKLSRNLKEWQEWSSGERVLKVAIDVSKGKHVACLGSSDKMLCRKLIFQNTAEGKEKRNGPWTVWVPHRFLKPECGTIGSLRERENCPLLSLDH